MFIYLLVNNSPSVSICSDNWVTVALLKLCNIVINIRTHIM